jgi:rRNA pseudouridine-1189 N-methylase Emg1 (Nep1/Mra1 family)
MEQTINKYECKEEILSDLIREITELREENKQLIADNLLLHNIIENQNAVISLKDKGEPVDTSMFFEYENEASYLCGCETEEDFETMKAGLENLSVRSLYNKLI